jgi:hypothetical protein
MAYGPVMLSNGVEWRLVMQVVWGLLASRLVGNCMANGLIGLPL